MKDTRIKIAGSLKMRLLIISFIVLAILSGCIFQQPEGLNIIVFIGVFSKAGYGINIDRVERQGNAFTVYG